MASSLLLITGATGLLGANVCRLALERGYRVRGLVRSTVEARPLAEIGVELLRGDITDLDSVVGAARGVDGIIHTAAAVGGTWTTFTAEEFHAVNYQGAVNVLEAAQREGVRRTVSVNTTSTLSYEYTMTERSPVADIKPGDSPYMSAKRAAYYEGMRRASLGQDLCFICPGALYGRSLLVDRAFAPTSFNSPLAWALNGELQSYPDFPFTWVHIDNAAEICLAAFERGKIGMRYLAAGLPEDVGSVATFCNKGCELAGVSHRVRAIKPGETEDLGSVRHLAERKWVSPMLDPSQTTEALGVQPTPMLSGLRLTLEWFREIGKL